MVLSEPLSNVLSFQGRLSASDGKPLTDGPYIVTFGLYAAPFGGAALWTETQAVTQIGGTFAAYLGSVTPFPSDLFAGGDRWLGIQVGAQPEISPRVRLTPSPWAIRALTADGAGSADLLDGQHGSFYQNASNLTLGTLLDARLSSNVALLNTAQTFTADKYFSGNVTIGGSPVACPLQVYNPSDDFGAAAIYGAELSTGTGQRHWGVYGETYSTATANAGAGVMGQAYYGNSSGVRGATPSDSGTGVLGWASSLTGSTYGVHGICRSPDGYAGYFEGRGYFSDMLTAGSGLTVGGNLTVGGWTILSQALAASGGITTTTLTATGAANLNTNLTVGNNTLIGGTLTVNGAMSVFGVLSGNGSGLYNLNAGNIGSGTVSDVRLSGNVDLLNMVQTITANKTFTGLVGIGAPGPTSALTVSTSDGNNPGILCTHSGTLSDTPAILGVHNLTDYWGVGVKGIGGYYGVMGEVVPSGAYGYAGVYGWTHGGSGSNYGVYGYATGGSNAYGVYGMASSASGSNYGGYFQGNVMVTGTLTKGGGSFKIDHPLDPENKYLSHSFVESPDMKNIYDGVVVLDANGTAVVELPNWFQALNRDFRYQLTCIGGYAPVYIAEEVTGNEFRIGGGTAGLKVSWQVTGIRQDAYANLHRIPVEENKPASERGKYLHPDAYGRPMDEGIGVLKQPDLGKR